MLNGSHWWILDGANTATANQIVTTLYKKYSAFMYLQDFSPKLSEANVKAGVFIELQTKMECKELSPICCLVKRKRHRTALSQWSLGSWETSRQKTMWS